MRADPNCCIFQSAGARLTLAAALTAMTVSCGQGSRTGDETPDAGDTETEADFECYDQLDIVFVLDVSGSMTHFVDGLEEEIGLVWEAALELDDDPHFGLVVFVDDFLVDNDGQPYASVETIQGDFHAWHEQAEVNLNTQTQSNLQNIDQPENSLDALHAAATSYTWRDAGSTLRVVIHATDDTFREHPDFFDSGIQAMSTYGETVSALQQRQIRVACFARKLDIVTGDTDVQAGFFTEYQGQAAIPAATSGEVFNILEVGHVLSLAEAINDFVIEEHCTPYVY